MSRTVRSLATVAVVAVTLLVPARAAAAATTADLSITKTDSPDPVVAGENVTYTITVTNSGPQTANTVQMKDTLPLETTYSSIAPPPGWACSNSGREVTCTKGTMGAGEQASFSLTATVRPETAQNAQITNSATVSSPEDESAGNNTDTETTTVTTRADLSVTKADDKTGAALAGDNISYTVTVTNGGPSSATPATMTDAVPEWTTFVSAVPATGSGWSCTTPPVGQRGDVSCQHSSLAPGTTTITIVVKVAANTPNATVISNTATVESPTADPDEADASDEELTPVVNNTAPADLSVTKSGAPADEVAAGSNLTYTIGVTNRGPSAAPNASLTDDIPAGTTFVSLTPDTDWTCTAPAPGATGRVSCTRGEIPAPTGAPSAETFSLVVKVNAATADGTTITNTATVAAETQDPVGSNNSATDTATVSSVADLEVTKTVTSPAPPAPVTAGNNITYNIALDNLGPNSAANVELTDVLPEHTTFVSVTPSPAAGWTCQKPAAGDPGTVTCSAATLASGATVNFELIVKVEELTPSGETIDNTASATSATTADPDGDNNSDSTTTPVVNDTDPADLNIMKSDSPDPVVAGANITYTITIRNAGPNAAPSVTLRDVVPTNTTFESLAAPPGWGCSTPAVGASGTVTCTRGADMPSSATTTHVFTLVVRVGETTASGTSIANTATVSSETQDPVTADNSATATTTTSASADLSVTKTDSPDPVAAGDNLTYTIEVTNGGPSVARDVALTDNLPEGTTFVSLAKPSGWTCTTPAAGTNGTVRCTRDGTLPVGSSGPFTLVVNVAVTTDGPIENAATVSSTTSDPDADDRAATATTDVTGTDPVADLSVTNTDSPDPVLADGQLTYTITVTNDGPSGAPSATLTDEVPAGTTFSSLTVPDGWTCTTPAAGGTGTVSCDTTAAFAPGSAAFALRVVVNSTAAHGSTITNTAAVSSATSDPDTADRTATATTTVNRSADLAVAMSASPDPVTEGDDITYAISVTNNGPHDAGATLTDVLPAGTTFRSLTSPSGWTCSTPAVDSGGTVTCTRASMSPSSSAAFTLVLRTVPGEATDSITNTASVSSSTADPAEANNSATTTTAVDTVAPPAQPQGYVLVGEDGSVYPFGSAKGHGDMKGTQLNAPIIGISYTPGGNGYWLVARDGGIFSFGDATFYGSMGGQKLNSPVLGMQGTPTGKGYWLFAGDGGIFSFGDAVFHGSMGNAALNAPVVQMEPLASGTGYWLVAGDGGIFSFGGAKFFGSTGNLTLNQPVFDMTSTDTDAGYWLVARDGGVFSFGDAEQKFYGSAVTRVPAPTKVIGMDSTPTSKGYWIADATGRIYEFGDAAHLGDRAFSLNSAPMVAFAAVPPAV